MSNNFVGKKENTPLQGKYLVNTFLRKYPGCFKEKTFLLLAFKFLRYP